MFRKLISVLFLIVLTMPENSISDDRINWNYKPTMSTDKFSGDDHVQDICVDETTIFYRASYSYGALDRFTGKLLWQKSWHDHFHSIELSVTKTALYAAVGEQYICKHDLRTGKEHWRIPFSLKYPKQMTAINDKLIAELFPGTISALNAENHTEIWKTRLVQTIRRENEGIIDRILLLENYLLALTNSRRLLRLDSKTGSIVWNYDIDKRLIDVKLINGFIFLTGNVPYRSSLNDGLVACIDPRDGSIIWERSVDGAYYLTYLEGQIIVSTQLGLLHSLNIIDGRIRWARTYDNTSYTHAASPDIVDNFIHVKVKEKILTFDGSGQKLGEKLITNPYDSKIYFRDSEGLIVLDNGSIARITVEKNTKKDLDENCSVKAEIKKLISRIDELTPFEKQVLLDNPHETITLLIPFMADVIAEMNKKETAQFKDSEINKAYFELTKKVKASDLVLENVFSPEYTEIVLSTLGESCFESNIFSILNQQGKPSLVIPFFLNHLKTLLENHSQRTAKMRLLQLEMIEAQDSNELNEYYDQYERLVKKEYSISSCANALTRHPDKEIISFFMDQLKNEESHSSVRRTAYINLAESQYIPAIELVLKLRDCQRTIPTLSDFIRHTIENEDGYNQIAPELLDFRKTANSETWGLYLYQTAGAVDDLWISKIENNSFTQLIFTGMTKRELQNQDWVSLFVGNETLKLDDDEDGWTNYLEQRLGTNPKDRDTDDDGIIDSKDKNPLVAPRILNDKEKIIAAAFEANFRFTRQRNKPCLVTYPQGIEPFELTGWNWVIIPDTGDEKHPLRALNTTHHYGTAYVQFNCPYNDFNNQPVTMERNDVFLIWSSDRNEVKIEVGTQYGGLDGQGMMYTLRRYKKEWIVIASEGSWVS